MILMVIFVDKVYFYTEKNILIFNRFLGRYPLIAAVKDEFLDGKPDPNLTTDILKPVTNSGTNDWKTKEYESTAKPLHLCTNGDGYCNLFLKKI